MLLCASPELERWQPDFSSSGQPSPAWTRVRCAGAEVTNALEWIDWEEPAVQVILCDQCGVSGCAVGGRAHVSRLVDHVVWSIPEPDGTQDPWERERLPSRLLATHGALAIPMAVWTSWPGVPPASALPPTCRRDLAAAWTAAAPPLEDVFATDAGDVERALALVTRMREWFAAEPTAEVRALVPVTEGTVTLFAESPRFTEWTPLALVDGTPRPVFAGRLMLLD